MSEEPVQVAIRLRTPAIPKVKRKAKQCETCSGIGLKIKRKYLRRDGRISTIVYDANTPCATCGGSGARE